MLPGVIGLVQATEAVKILANVEAFHGSAGGVGGAEGAVWIIWRGKRDHVEAAQQIVAGIQGEDPFIR